MPCFINHFHHSLCIMLIWLSLILLIFRVTVASRHLISNSATWLLKTVYVFPTISPRLQRKPQRISDITVSFTSILMMALKNNVTSGSFCGKESSAGSSGLTWYIHSSRPPSLRLFIPLPLTLDTTISLHFGHHSFPVSKSPSSSAFTSFPRVLVRICLAPGKKINCPTSITLADIVLYSGLFYEASSKSQGYSGWTAY